MLTSRINVYLDRPSGIIPGTRGPSGNIYDMNFVVKYVVDVRLGIVLIGGRMSGDERTDWKKLFQDFENGANVVFSSAMRSN